MKRLLTILLLAALLLTACASSNPPLDNETTEVPTDAESTTLGEVESTTPQESEIDTTEQNPPKELLNEFPQLTQNSGWSWIKETLESYQCKELKDLTPIDYNHISTILPTPFGGYWGSCARQLYHAQEWGLPIENIMITDNMHVCVVYKLVNDTAEREIYFYQFFERSYDTLAMKTTFESYIASESLQFSDFDDLKIGDPLEKAAQVSPIVEWKWVNYFYPDNYILLEDGILHLWFENTVEYIANPVLVIGGMDFYPYGTDAEINGQTLSILKAENRPPLPSADD